MDPIAQHAHDRPDALALIQGDRTRTWSELDRRANQAARVLQKSGVGPGDVVAVALRNSIEFFELIGGAGRIGATVMPVSFRNMRDEVEYLVEDARAVAVFGEPDNRPVFDGLPKTIFRGEPYEALLADEDDGPLQQDQAGTSMPALRYYTSGTTGRPKAVIRTQGPRDPEDLATTMARSRGTVSGR